MLNEQEIDDKLAALSLTDTAVSIIFEYIKVGYPVEKAMKIAVISLAEGSELDKEFIAEKSDVIDKLLSVPGKYKDKIPKEVMKKIEEDMFNIIASQADKCKQRFDDLTKADGE